MKHTKGTWIIDERDNSIFIEAVGKEDGETYAVNICKMHGNDDIDKADARLIAAAPELLEVLLAVYNNSEANEALTDNELKQVEAAIKKATT